MNGWKKFFDALKAASVDVYTPGARYGLCTSPYCVINRIGSLLTGTNQGWARYRITMLVPIDSPAMLDELYERVRCALSPFEEDKTAELAAPLGAVLVDDEFSALVGYCDYAVWFAQ